MFDFDDLDEVSPVADGRSSSGLASNQPNLRRHDLEPLDSRPLDSLSSASRAVARQSEPVRVNPHLSDAALQDSLFDFDTLDNVFDFDELDSTNLPLPCDAHTPGLELPIADSDSEVHSAPMKRGTRKRLSFEQWCHITRPYGLNGDATGSPCALEQDAPGCTTSSPQAVRKLEEEGRRLSKLDNDSMFVLRTHQDLFEGLQGFADTGKTWNFSRESSSRSFTPDCSDVSE